MADIYVENGATALGTTDNDRFIITKETGDATIEAGLKGNDTLYFNTPLTNYYARYVKDTKDLAVRYRVKDDNNWYVLTIKDYFTSVKATDSKSSLKNVYFVKNDTKYEGSFIDYTEFYYLPITPNKKNVVTGTKFSDHFDYSGEYDKAYTINGGKGNDYIVGGELNDTINGGDGDDTLSGSGGDDILTGGKGSNTYIIEYKEGTDTINLTKNENANIRIGYYKETDINYTLDDKGNGIISYGEDEYAVNAIIKNLAKKDLAKTLILTKRANGETIDLKNISWTYETNKNYKGGYLNELIDASAITEPTRTTKAGKIGVTLDGGTGNDRLYGSNFNDTIKGGVGNDEITGGKGNDAITGGAGVTVVNYAKGDGDDTITLTKGENFTLNMSDLKLTDLNFEVVKKDLKISYDKDGKQGSVTIKNFASKDVTSNKTKKADDTSSVELIAQGQKVDLRTKLLLTGKDKITINKNYNGSWLSEEIDANEYVIYKDKARTVVQTDVTKKGLTIDGKGGNDVIIGTNYSDTIKAGTGIDEITGGTGNDKLYGGTTTDSETTFVFKEGDGADIINSGKGVDTLLFKNVDFNTVSFSQGEKKNNKDMIISYGNGDTITVKNYYTVDKKGNITGVNEKNSVKNIRYSMDDGGEVIYLNSGSATVKVDMSMFTEFEWSTDDYKDYVEKSVKTIYLGDDANLTLDFDKELFENALGVFCRGTGLDNDLYISMSNAADPGYGIVIKDYFDENGNPKAGQVNFNIWEYPEIFSTERVQKTYTFEEWADGSTWERTFDIQPFNNSYDKPLNGTNMPYEEIRAAYGDHDDVIYANGGNDTIYTYGGHNIIYSDEGNKLVSMWGAQSENEIYLGKNADTNTIIHLGGVNSVTSNIDSKGDLNISWTSPMDYSDETYTSTARVDKWTTKTSQASISMAGSNNDDVITAVDGTTNILDGREGDDLLIGGTGADTFNLAWNSGFGIDTIRNAKSEDNITLEWASNVDVNFNELKFYKNDNGKNLVINSKGLSDKESYAIIEDYFTSNNKVNKVIANKWADDNEETTITELISGKTATMGSFEIAKGNNTVGSNYSDVLMAKSGENTITGGKGNDTLYTIGGENIFVFNNGDGYDTLYQEGGSTVLKFNNANIADLSSITGYDRDTSYYNDLLIHYGENDTLRVKDFYNKNKNTATTLIDTTGSQYNMTDYFKYVVYAKTMLDFMGSSKNEEIRVLAPTDFVAGGKGSDRIYASDADEDIFTGLYNNYTDYDSKAGVVDEVHAGKGDDYIFATSETNILYGDEGDDTIYVLAGAKNIISDSSGNDTLSINSYNGSTNADYNNLHFVFNVDKTGVVDDNGLRILTNDEFELWKQDTNHADIKGINIVKDADGKGGYNCIETFIDALDNEISMSKIEAVKSDITSWLSSKNYDDVSAVFNTPDNEADITALVAKFDVTSQWTLV